MIAANDTEHARELCRQALSHAAPYAGVSGDDHAFPKLIGQLTILAASLTPVAKAEPERPVERAPVVLPTPPASSLLAIDYVPVPSGPEFTLTWADGQPTPEGQPNYDFVTAAYQADGLVGLRALDLMIERARADDPLEAERGDKPFTITPSAHALLTLDSDHMAHLMWEQRGYRFWVSSEWSTKNPKAKVVKAVKALSLAIALWADTLTADQAGATRARRDSLSWAGRRDTFLGRQRVQAIGAVIKGARVDSDGTLVVTVGPGWFGLNRGGKEAVVELVKGEWAEVVLLTPASHVLSFINDSQSEVASWGPLMGTDIDD